MFCIDSYRQLSLKVASKQLLDVAGKVKARASIDDAELCGLACRPPTAIHRNITTAAFTSQTHYTSCNLDILSKASP